MKVVKAIARFLSVWAGVALFFLALIALSWATACFVRWDLLNPPPAVLARAAVLAALIFTIIPLHFVWMEPFED